MKPFLVLICSLAFAFAARGQVTSTGGGDGEPKKKQAQTAQRAVTAGGERTGNVNPRQIMMQSQHHPSTETKKNMKGSQSQQAAGRPETMDKMNRIQHYQDENVTGLKGVEKPRRSTTERESMDLTSEERRNKLDKPTFGEKFKMSLSHQPAGKSTSVAAQSQGKPADATKKDSKVSPTPRP